MGKGHEQTSLKRRHTCSQQTHTKKVQYHWSLEKCKSKLQCDTISCQSEWRLLVSQQTTDAGEVIEKREHLHTAGKSTN